MANQSKALNIEYESPPWNRVALKLHHCLSQFHINDLTKLLPKYNPWMIGAHRQIRSQTQFITFRDFEAHLDALHQQMVKERILPDKLSSALESCLALVLQNWHNIIYYYPKNQLLIEALEVEVDFDLSHLDEFLQQTHLEWLLDFLQLNVEAKTDDVNEEYCQLINPFVREVLDKELFIYAIDLEHLKYTQWVLEHQLNSIVGFARKSVNPPKLYDEYDAIEDASQEKNQASTATPKEKKRRRRHKSDSKTKPQSAQIQPIAQATTDDKSRPKKESEIFDLLLAYLDINLTDNEDLELPPTDAAEADNSSINDLENENVLPTETSNFNWLMEEGSLLLDVKKAERENHLREKWILMSTQYAQLKKLHINENTLKQYQSDFTNPTLYFHSLLIKEPYKITHGLLRHKIVNSLCEKEYQHELIIENEEKKQLIWDTINDVLLSETLKKYEQECLDQKVLELVEVQVTSQRHRGRSSHMAINELIYANYISVENRLAHINSVKAQLDSAQTNDVDFKRLTPITQIIQALFPWAIQHEHLSKYIADKLFRRLYIKLRMIEENEYLKVNEDAQTVEFIKFKIEETCAEKAATQPCQLADIEEAGPKPIVFKLSEEPSCHHQNAYKCIHWQEPLIKPKGL